VHLWNLNTHTKLHVFDKLGSLVTHVAFSPAGRLLAVASWAGNLTLFDTNTYQPRHRIHRIGGVRWSAFSLDNKRHAVVDNGTKVYVFPTDTSADAESQKEIADSLTRMEDDSYDVREQATQRLAAIGPAAASQLVAAANSPSAEVRWRTRMLRQRMSRPESAVQITGHLDQLECVCFSPDGTLLPSGDSTGHVKVWRVGTWEQIASLSIKGQVEQ
jgi:WD40 repeat protein